MVTGPLLDEIISGLEERISMQRKERAQNGKATHVVLLGRPDISFLYDTRTNALNWVRH